MNQALHEIDLTLQENGSSCAALGLPIPHGVFESGDNSAHAHNVNSPPNFDDLNTQQRNLLEIVLHIVHANAEEGSQPHVCCYYVDAPGGCGKTYLFNRLAVHLQQHNHKVACAAWTGIAATLMVNGRTVHNLFKLPVPIVETSTCNVSPTSKHADILRSQSLFIIDEASMIPTHALHAIDRCLQDITGTI